MSISKELFLAILSMDAYNRNYGAGISLRGDRVGTATITKDSEKVFADPDAPEGTPTAAQAAGFYAIAYTLTEAVGEEGNTLAGGTTIISYRGTDASIDYLKGWLVGAGVTAPITQADETMAFYHAVAGPLGPDADLIVTGHSLGGGRVARSCSAAAGRAA